jgi:hypothetical protein
VTRQAIDWTFDDDPEVLTTVREAVESVAGAR